MSEETKNASADETSNEETQATSVNVEIQTQAETAEEKKEADRPGVCCGSCS